jgi:hypothetical protein
LMKIFVASSAAARAQANTFIKGFSHHADITFRPWWEEFKAGKTLLAELTRIRKEMERAILVLSPDSKATLDRGEQPIPNLNVLFEFGFFYGALGPDKVAVVRYGQIYLPSNLGGYIHITGSERFTPRRAVPVGKRTRSEFERWLKPPEQPNDLPMEQAPAQVAFRKKAQTTKSEQVLTEVVSRKRAQTAKAEQVLAEVASLTRAQTAKAEQVLAEVASLTRAQTAKAEQVLARLKIVPTLG